MTSDDGGGIQIFRATESGDVKVLDLHDKVNIMICEYDDMTQTVSTMTINSHTVWHVTQRFGNT